MRWYVPLAALAILFLAACTTIPEQPAPAEAQARAAPTATLPKAATPPEVGLSVGNTAPDFTVTTTDGQQVRIQSFPEQGKPVLVYFMATWCPFCARDYAALSQVYNEYEQDVPVLSISLDLKENAALLSEYKKKYPALDTMLLAPGTIDVLTGYQVRSTTTKYAIGRDGTILYAGSGAIDTSQWRTLLDALKAS